MHWLMGLAAVSQRTLRGVYDTHHSLTLFRSRIVSHGKEEGIRKGLKGRGQMLQCWGCAEGWVQTGNTGTDRAKAGRRQGGL